MNKLLMCSFVVVDALMFGCRTADSEFVNDSQKLKIISQVDVSKWGYYTKRSEVVDAVSFEAVIFATMHRVLFKAKEGGVYGVDFFKDSRGEYKIVSIVYYPKYPDEFPFEIILREQKHEM
jgi:hypothetical protein